MEPILYQTIDHAKLEQRKRRKRYWLVAFLLLLSIVLLAYGFWLLPLLFHNDNEATYSWQDKNIPLYSHQTFQTRTNYTLHDPKTQKPTFYFEKRIYSSADSEQQIKDYFSQQFPLAGWSIAPPDLPNALSANNGQTTLKVTLQRGRNEKLLFELGLLNSRTIISFTYEQTF